MEIKFKTTTKSNVKPKVIHPIKYSKIHKAMFDAVQQYADELYPEYEVTGIKIIVDKK